MSERRSRVSSRTRTIATLESLEERALLSTVVFNPPDLKPYIRLAEQGQNTAQATIDKMTSSLESQLTSGPLAALNAGTVDGNGFVTEVQQLSASFQANADTQLSPRFPNVDQLIKLQGDRIVADVISLNQQNTVGMITSTQLSTQATTAIQALTAGPLYSLKTPFSAYVSTTDNFISSVTILNAYLSTTSTPALTAQQVSDTLTAEAEAYRGDMHSALMVTHSNISTQVDAAVNTLETTVSNIAKSGSSTAQTEITNAISVFSTTILDTTGLFGSSGALRETYIQTGYIPHNLNAKQVATTLSGVSGTMTVGGTATLTASLSATNATGGLAGKTIVFTLDGAFAGTAVTNSSGVATLTDVPSTATVGTGTGSVVASFAGDVGYRPSNQTGDLTVSQATSTLSAVSASASLGGTATLTATLKSGTSGQGIAGATVDFTLNGTSVGTGTTDANGVATLSGVATTAGVGTQAGVVGASFAGNTDYKAAANATGDLTVNKATSAVSAVSGTATYGGTATLTATLKSSITGNAISGASVTFTLSGASVGSATTDANGLATLTGVTSTAGAGTVTGAVVATFAGDSNYLTSNNTGNLVVSQAGTVLSSIGGTATGGLATLTATIKSSVTGNAISGQTIAFTLDGVSAGTGTTNASGVATVSGISTSDPVGTHTGVLSVSYASTANYSASTGTGDLVVS